MSTTELATSGSEWELSLAEAEARSRRTAWIVAGAACAIALAEAIAIAMLTPLHSTVPYVVQVDRATGDTSVIQTGHKTVSTTDMIDKHWIQAYVAARNRYIYRLLQADYDTVQLLTDASVWSPYAAQFEGRDALDKKFGETVEITPSIISIVLSGNNTATVRLQKETRSVGGADTRVQRYTVLMRYEYAPKPLAKESERVNNPFGFKVTAYKMDEELAK